MKYFILFAFIFSMPLAVTAQQMFPIYRDSVAADEVDYYVELDGVSIVSKQVFKNDTARYRYNQMKHYIKQVLPYVDNAVKMFYEIDQATAQMSRGAKRRFIRSREKQIKTNFQDKLKSLNRTQGKYLVKAINRNLGKSCYTVVKELKNPVKAAYYRSIASINGIDLDEQYDAANNRNFERIMKKLGY